MEIYHARATLNTTLNPTKARFKDGNRIIMKERDYSSAVIVELKAVEQISPLHHAQLMTYLRLSELRLGLLINFNVLLIKDGIKRMVI